VVGRIVGASVSGNAFEGLLVICGAYIIWVGIKFLGILLF
jgi:threonine/homoserine/homoserine lactone efflux protein